MRLKHEEELYEQEYQDLKDEETPSDLQSVKESEEFNKEWDKFADRDITYNEYLF